MKTSSNSPFLTTFGWLFLKKNSLRIPTNLFFASLILCVSIQTKGQAVINAGKTNQIIDGFGGSSAWSGRFSDGLMDAIFKNGNNQLGLTILRSRIDPNKNWADEKSNAQKAKARGAMTFATPWSPPANMKTNNNVNYGGFIKSTEWGNYANYLNEYIDYVGKDLDIISLQNEPDWKPNYESCEWTPAQFLDFARNHAGKLKRPVMLPESLGFNWAFSDPVLNDPEAAKNISYVGGHLYGSQPKSYTKAMNLGKHVWMTEFGSDDRSANGMMHLSKQILDCMYQNFNAYVYWWMTSGGDGIISSAGVPNKYGYILSSFSKFVRPGYYRVDATYNPQSGVYIVAFKGATKFVTVVVNNSTSAKTQQFTVQNASVSSMTKYTTSISKNVANDGTVAVANGSFSSTLDAQSLTTFVGDLGNVPSVHFTAPAQNATFMVGTPIPLAVTATITSGSIANVKFYDGTTLLATSTASPYNYSWTNATAGAHIVKAIATDNAGHTAEESVTIKVNVPQGPYGGTVWSIPGTIQLEKYDVGGNGYAYNDLSAGNTGGATFRSDEDVDIENCTDTGGGYNIGFAQAGEWTEYSVEVTSAGLYDIELRAAADGDNRTVLMSMGGTSLGTAISIPNTSGWQNWKTIVIKNVQLKEGKQVFRLTIGTTDYVNLNYVEFKHAISTGLDDIKANGVSLYPNPFYGDGLQIKNGGEFKYRICGVNGVLLEEGNASSSKTVGQGLQTGIYFLTIENEKGIFVQKIVRQ